MLTLGSLAFASPWLLLGLAALPVLWWLLRVTPPAPRRVRFPAAATFARARPARRNPGEDAAVAHHPAHGARRADHPGARPSAAQPDARASPATARWCWRSITAGPRRGIGTSAAPRSTASSTQAEREGRHIVLLRTAPPPGDAAPQRSSLLRPADARAAANELAPLPWPADRAAALARLDKLDLERRRRHRLAERRHRRRRRAQLSPRRFSALGPLRVMADARDRAAALARRRPIPRQGSDRHGAARRRRAAGRARRARGRR